MALRRRGSNGPDDQTAGEDVAPARRARTGAAGRSEREVRSGARHLATEPDTEEALALKQRLTEAVTDLADSIEEMPGRGGKPGRRLSSDEMIALAKQRIRQRAEGGD